MKTFVSIYINPTNVRGSYVLVLSDQRRHITSQEGELAENDWLWYGSGLVGVHIKDVKQLSPPHQEICLSPHWKMLVWHNTVL